MKRLKILIAFSCLSVTSAAQENADSIIQMEQVTVTATRKVQALVSLPYAAEVLHRNQLERQLSRTVPEALQGVPGVFIQKTNHAGGSPFVRGLTGNQSLILVDGIRMNNAIFRYGPNQYMTLIDPLIVDRIEVVKGTGSVQYGSDAMTGVINIHTQNLQFQDKPEWKETLQSRITSNGMETTWRPEIRYAGKRIAFVVGADTKRFGDLKGGDTTGFQRPSGYQEKALDVKLKVDAGKGWLIKLANHWLAQDNVPVYHKYRLENFAVNTSDPISRGFSYVQARKTFQKGLIRQMDFFTSRQYITETRYTRKNASTATRYERDAISTVAAGADVFMKFTSQWDANSGIEMYADEVRSYRNDFTTSLSLQGNKRGLYPDRSTYQNMAAYSMHHLHWHRLNIEAGLRYNQYVAKLNDQTLGKVALKPGALVFQGGINYRLAGKWYVYANLSEGFRAPNIDDLGTLGIVDFRYEIPAYGLKPERSLNMESGLKYAAKQASFSASVFRTNLSGLISRIKTPAVVAGYDVYTKVNVDKAFIKGWEAQAAVEPMKGLLLSGSATSLFGESITKAQPLRRIPPFNSRLSAEYRQAAFRAGLLYDHAAPQRRLEAGDKADNRIPVGGTPGFNILHAFAGFEKGFIATRLYLNNIFNADYRTHGSGINGMGRSVSLTTTIQFSQFK
jgi:hemoglobin/transferrin/lactoferrin receptor protein